MLCTNKIRCMNAMLGGSTFHALLMNQMTAKTGIKKHGEAAIAALIKEVTHNLHEKEVIEENTSMSSRKNNKDKPYAS